MPKTFAIGLLIFFCFFSHHAFARTETASPKIVFLNSYHNGFSWSDKILKTYRRKVAKFNGRVYPFHMDTKRNFDNEYLDLITVKSVAFIEEIKPDLIIASDDNASKYVIQKYFKNHKIPVVFVGVNLDAYVYGYPYENATGLVESAVLPPLLKALTKTLPKNSQYAVLFTNTTTSQKKLKYYQNIYADIHFEVVNSFEQWQFVVTDLTDKGYIIIMDNIASVNNFDAQKAHDFIAKNAKQLTVNLSSMHRTYTHFTYDNLPQEQGAWAARATLAILQGTRPVDIKIQKSKHFKLSQNKGLIADSNVHIPSTLIHLASKDD
ncbi:hypothetical protein HR060_04405 [Catenovulum sp. SM1970]|uniref:ABC transporter substrate-binding protein n=1 Tax=Marinifaba aquimaris TaxID=2741323 RepID=UPI00157394A8|nr:ABC transporter substrate binding protein [Marinifaba aquimaris]NTS76103.1 hypothetical protein [Marinifaba aquimaris]